MQTSFCCSSLFAFQRDFPLSNFWVSLSNQITFYGQPQSSKSPDGLGYFSTNMSFQKRAKTSKREIFAVCRTKKT